ncbi:hypothetical protein ACQP1G_30665 [Nocardia sp. CA-107356]
MPRSSPPTWNRCPRNTLESVTLAEQAGGKAMFVPVDIADAPQWRT